MAVGDDAARRLRRTGAARRPIHGVAAGLLAMLAALAGCSGPEVDITQNHGGMCIYSGEPTYHGSSPQRFEAGDAFWVTVESPCMSSNCDFLHDAYCSVGPDGDVILVESEFVIEHAGGRSCAVDCVIDVAVCGFEPLSAGEFTIVHGDAQRSLTVPSMVTQNCMGTVY